MKNITLYVQYILAQYFAAKDAAEQVTEDGSLKSSFQISLFES